jgi:hypothetical protein
MYILLLPNCCRVQIQSQSQSLPESLKRMPELTGQSLMFGHHEAQASCDVNRFVSGSMFSLGSDSLGHGCVMAHGCDASTYRNGQFIYPRDKEDFSFSWRARLVLLAIIKGKAMDEISGKLKLETNFVTILE